jgi:hypothetical protein
MNSSMNGWPADEWINGLVDGWMKFSIIYPCMDKVKVKLKLSLCLTMHYDMKTYWGSGGRAPRILWRSALDGGEWSASCPGRFTPRERAPLTHWIEGWVGPRTVLDAVVKRKIPSPRRESNPRTLIVQPVVQRYTDWAITALMHTWMDELVD